MTPNKAQRTWKTLSTKWINASPYGSSFGRGGLPQRKNTKRKIKKGILTNLIPVEVVNAITGEVSKGYMRDLSTKKLRQWLGYHNHKAQVEQVYLSPKMTLAHLDTTELMDFPILIKLGRYQVPYLIDHTKQDAVIRGKQTVAFNLKTADNLKYLEIIAERKGYIMKLFKKIKKAKKK
jgi:hypothetical protein